MPNSIDIDFYYVPEKPGEVGFLLTSTNGKKIPAQEILDAISQVLLEQYDYWVDGPKEGPAFDA